MEIVKLSSYTLKDMNKANEAFEIIGKIKLIICRAAAWYHLANRLIEI